MSFIIGLLVLISSLAIAIVVSRRIERASVAIPAGIFAGIAVLALLYFFVTAVFAFSLLNTGPVMPLGVN
ncbi:MAG: hypothetical protein ACJA2X_000264 [Halocynthiibacter sp.]|jgi:hypothetical protein